MLACNCLNVVIELEKNEKVTKEQLELTDEEKHDSFFEQEVWHVGQLISIKNHYSDLVHSRVIGLWTIYICFNCSVQTHAIHKEKGVFYVLVHSKLQNEEGINNVKLSSIFSPVYQIIINPNNIIIEPAPLNTHLNKGLEKVFRNIDEVARKYLVKEQILADEKIRKFTDEQYQLLNEVRDKAIKDKEALVRLIENAKRESNIESPKSPKPIEQFTNKSPANSPASVPFSPKRPKNVDARRQPQKGDFREDLIFDFEVEEFNINNLGSFHRNQNSDDSDTEDVEEAEDAVNDATGISILQGKSTFSGGIVAKSCPVDIPIFSPLSRSRSSRGEAGENIDSPSSNQAVDIAASIKALARSVHGDPIFGELPRPKFSTQI